MAQSVYEYYVQYTGVHLPQTKMDLVTVPGCREPEPHWGLIRFEERSLLLKRGSGCKT